MQCPPLIMVFSAVVLAAAFPASPSGIQAHSVIVPRCPDPADCTTEIQAALNRADSHHSVRLTAARSPWVSLPLNVSKSNVLLEIETGAVLLAKRWAFRAEWACLLTVGVVSPTNNFTLRGGGTLRMWRRDYGDLHNYSFSENRMALRLEDVSNVLVEDILLEEAGGDGIFVVHARNVTIRNTTCRNNRRQGMSILSAHGVQVFSSTFEGSSGIGPQAGIDIEPENYHNRLEGIVFDSCTFQNNTNAGFIVSPHALKNTSGRIEVTMKNSRIINSGAWSALLVADRHSTPGFARFENVEITVTGEFNGTKGLPGNAIKVYRGPKTSPETFMTVFENVTIRHHGSNPYQTVVVSYKATNVDFGNMNIIFDKRSVPRMFSSPKRLKSIIVDVDRKISRGRSSSMPQNSPSTEGYFLVVEGDSHMYRPPRNINGTFTVTGHGPCAVWKYWADLPAKGINLTVNCLNHTHNTNMAVVP